MKLISMGDQPGYRPSSTPDGECLCLCEQGCGRPVTRASHDYRSGPNPIGRGQPRNYARGHHPGLNRNVEGMNAARLAGAVPVLRVQEFIREVQRRKGWSEAEVCLRLSWSHKRYLDFMRPGVRQRCVTREWMEWCLLRLSGKPAAVPPLLRRHFEAREVRLVRVERNLTKR